MKKLILLQILISINVTFGQTNLDVNKNPLLDSILQSYHNPNDPLTNIGIVKDDKTIYNGILTLFRFII